MTHLAHVFGPSRHSRISAEAALLLLRARAADIKTFEDIEEAKACLGNACAFLAAKC
jgi:hypothetical protein